MKKSLVISTIAVGLAFVVLLAYLSRYDWNPAVLVAMPDHWADCLGDVPSEVVIGGSDGGYNYAAARDPFLTRAYPECARSALAYTMERWLYQFLAWALALGQEGLLPCSMPLVNLLSVGLTGFFCALALQHRGMNPWWSFLCALNPGIWQPLRFNLVDPIFVAMVVAALYFYNRKRPLPTTIFLALAMLARGIAIGVVLVLAGMAVLERRNWREAMFYGAATLPYYLVLKPWLNNRLDFPSIPFGGADLLTWPLITPISQLFQLLRHGEVLKPLLLVSALAFFIFAIVMACWAMWKEKRIRYEALLVIGYSAVILCIGNASWGAGPIQMFRVVAFIFPCLIYLFRQDRSWAAQLLMISIPAYSLIGPLWMITAPIMR